MSHVYQLVLLGEKIEYEELIVNRLLMQTEMLGIQNEFIKVINRLNFNEYLPNNPTYCLYFTSPDIKKDIDLVDTLIKDATLIVTSLFLVIQIILWVNFSSIYSYLKVQMVTC